MKDIKILCADDEKDFVEMLKEYLDPRGYDISIAYDTEKILDLLDTNKYDVALLDLKMKGIDGDDALKHVKRKKLSTKAVFITAYNDSGRSKRRLMRLGAFAYLEKPISSLKHLEKVIQDAAEAIRKERETACSD